MNFDFATVKATATKPADIPAQHKPRNLAVNPLADHFAQSFAKVNVETGEGPWFTLKNLPVTGSFEKSPYGEVVKTALVKLQAAAGDVGSGIEKRVVVADDGKSATIHFRAMPKRKVNRKTKAEKEAEAATETETVSV